MRAQAEGAAAGAASECDPRGGRAGKVGGAIAAPAGPHGPGVAGREAARPREEVGPGGARRLLAGSAADSPSLLRPTVKLLELPDCLLRCSPRESAGPADRPATD